MNCESRETAQAPEKIGGLETLAFRGRLSDGSLLDLYLVPTSVGWAVLSCRAAGGRATRPIAERCPNATVCLDPFHVVKLATDALDEIRREVRNQARRAGMTAVAKQLKGARFALWKNPERLTERQKLKLAAIKQTNEPLYRGYLISQQLRQIYRVPHEQAIVLLDAWLAWARRCRLEPFVKLARTITDQRAGIEAAIQHGHRPPGVGRPGPRPQDGREVPGPARRRTLQAHRAGVLRHGRMDHLELVPDFAEVADGTQYAAVRGVDTAASATVGYGIMRPAGGSQFAVCKRIRRCGSNTPVGSYLSSCVLLACSSYRAPAARRADRVRPPREHTTDQRQELPL